MLIDAPRATVPDLTAIDPDDVVGEYRQRRLDRVPDVELVETVARILALPRADAPDSFVLHAPLELLARAALLPHVSPHERERVRRRIVSIAARFEAFGPPAEPTAVTFSADTEAAEALVAALGSGDLDLAWAAGRFLGLALDADRLIPAVADQVGPSLAAAAHGPIFLHQLPRVLPRSAFAGAMFGTLGREVARHPDWAIRWIDDHALASTDAGTDLAVALAATPVVGPPDSTFIYPLMSQVDSSGLAEDVAAAAIGPGTDLAHATRSILRIATASMLLDDPAHAPYGWSHCLTIPQGVLTAARTVDDPRTLIAVAATHVVGFRAALGSAPLRSITGPGGAVTHDGLLPDLRAPDHAELQAVIDHAATHHDAHLAKYVLACLDAARTDPRGMNQHLRAAAHLSNWWRRADRRHPSGQ